MRQKFLYAKYEDRILIAIGQLSHLMRFFFFLGVKSFAPNGNFLLLIYQKNLFLIVCSSFSPFSQTCFLGATFVTNTNNVELCYVDSTEYIHQNGSLNNFAHTFFWHSV